jgi:predicted alpha/beta-fold hydrolase
MLAGISLGGIIVANSLARDVFGDAIDGGVSISGSCEIAKNIEYQHSLNVWQPILAQGLKRIFVDDPIPLRKLKRAIGGDADSRIQNIMTVFDFDTVVVTALNGFDDVMHYYDDISATPAMLEKGLHKPLLLLHALDDPITHVDTVSPAKTKPSPFLFTLLTSVGGHVGWPLGWFPWRRRWEFQNRVAIEFLESVLSSNCKYNK